MPFLGLGLVNAIIRSIAGSWILPETRVIRTCDEERMSVNSLIKSLLAFPSSSSIRSPLWFWGIIPARV